MQQTITTQQRLYLRVLGTATLELGGKPLHLGTRKGLALLSYLAVRRDDVSKAELETLLWPEHDDKRARGNLRDELYRLGQVLPAGVILTRRHDLRLNEETLEVDLWKFERALAENRPEDALAFYGGSLLAGLHVRAAEPFESWLGRERSRLEERYLEVLETLADKAESLGDYSQGLEYLQQGITTNPLAEHLYVRAMRLSAWLGNRADALKLYERLKTILEELGVTLSDEVESLVETISNGNLTASNPTIQHNLPAPLTPLVGREQERLELQHLLARADVRLVTLTGPGGVGKTRLGLQVAHDVADDFADGVHFVSLAALRDASLVSATITQTLGLVARTRAPLEQLKESLREKQLLLVLDNFEQLLPAREVILELLSACPHLKVLVTSRAVLHVQGEYEMCVSPLALPSVTHLPAFEVLRDYPALMLFSQRAKAVEPSFKLSESNVSTIADICTRLDGLPLAIELAAARVKLFSPSALLARLEQRLPLLTHGPNDLLERHRALRSTLEWGYELLNSSEQGLFAQLAVFVGGFTLEAAEAVCQLEDNADVLSGVSSLLDKSLLQRHCVAGEVRFGMLETIREYALEKLEASGDAELIQSRHTAYFLKFAEGAEAHLLGAEETLWKQRLENDHDNVRAVLERSLTEHGDAEAGLQLAGSFWRFWHVCEHFSEGRNTLARVLAGTRGNTPQRAKALFGAGVLADVQSDHASARVYFLESLVIWQALGDQANVAKLLNGLGMNAWSQAQLTEARAYFEKSLAIRQELGDKHGLPARMNLGLVAYTRGDYAAARTFFEESLIGYQEKNFLAAVANVLSNLGLVAQAEHCYEQAQAFYQEAVTILEKERDMECIVSQLAASASLGLVQGQHEQAARLFAASAAWRERIGAPLRPVERPAYERNLDALRAVLGEDVFLASWAEGKIMSLEQALNYALGDD